MRISLTNTIWQVFNALLLFSICFGILQLVRHYTPRLSNEPRLFPRHLLKEDKLINEYRARIAEGILANYSSLSSEQNSPVEIRIVASNRGGTYLLQTFAFLLEQKNAGGYNLSVCNVEDEVFEGLKRIEKWTRIATIGENGTKQVGTSMSSRIAKENQDYWKCLELPSEARYILLIEDDSLIISQFSNLLNSLIQQLDHLKHIDYVKLYHPIKLRKIPSIIHLSVFSFTVALVVSSIFYRHFPFVTFTILFILLTYHCITGYDRQFSAEIRYMLTGSAYVSVSESCCTPSVIFRSEAIPEMVRYFKNTVGSPDHAKDHILDESRFVGRQSDLNYVAHIGSFSSIRRRAVHLSDLNTV